MRPEISAFLRLPHGLFRVGCCVVSQKVCLITNFVSLLYFFRVGFRSFSILCARKVTTSRGKWQGGSPPR